MASRSKWEDMVNKGVDYALKAITPSKKEAKPEDAPVGSGMAEKAKKDISGYKSRQKKELEDIDKY